MFKTKILTIMEIIFIFYIFKIFNYLMYFYKKTYRSFLIEAILKKL